MSLTSSFAKRAILAKRFSGYAITGGTAACVDAGFFYLLLSAGTATGLAALTSFFLAAIVNFVMTARFVFGHRLAGRGLTRFMLAAIAGLLINVSVTLAAVELFGLPPMNAKVAGIGTAFFFNFFLNLNFVFREH